MEAQKNQTFLTLNNGVVIPQFGLGVYSIPAGEATYNSVLTALKAGYRPRPMPTRMSAAWDRLCFLCATINDSNLITKQTKQMECRSVNFIAGSRINCWIYGHSYTNIDAQIGGTKS